VAVSKDLKLLPNAKGIQIVMMGITVPLMFVMLKGLAKAFILIHVATIRRRLLWTYKLMNTEVKHRGTLKNWVVLNYFFLVETMKIANIIQNLAVSTKKHMNSQYMIHLVMECVVI